MDTSCHMIGIVLRVALIMLLLVAPVGAQPRLVSDVNRLPAGASTPFGFVVGGADVVYLAIDDPRYGKELWRTDATPGGATLVAEVVPGPDGGFDAANSAFWDSAFRITPTDAGVFFVASDGRRGGELWFADEASGRAAMIHDLDPGPNGTIFDGVVSIGRRVVLFVEGGIEDELWGSDGTTRGTRLLAQIGRFSHRVCDECSERRERSITVLDGRAIFVAFDEAHGWEPWVSDGTAAGTGLLRDIASGGDSSWADDFRVVGGRVYFAASDAVRGRELWRTDGTTEGTEIVLDVVPGPGSFYPSNVIPFRSDLLVRGRMPEAAGELWGIWRLSPTGEVRRVADPYVDLVRADLGGRVVGAGTDAAHGSELWVSDGTPEGTGLLADLSPGPRGSYPHDLTPLGGRVFFVADVPGLGEELWVTDGTTAGTRLVADIDPGAGVYAPRSLTPFGSRLLFVTRWPETGFALSVSDGTAEGTAPVEILDRATQGAEIREIVDLDGTLIFGADDGTGREPWRSDGMDAGTAPVADVGDSPYGSQPYGLVRLGLSALFGALRLDTGFELWRTDGTSAGTFPLIDLATGPTSGFGDPGVVAGASLFFTARGLQSDLFATDGTPEGTRRVKDFVRGRPNGLTEFRGEVYFALNAGQGTELWRSDGTDAGTRMVLDAAPGELSSSPAWLASIGDRLYYTALLPGFGRELWVSDGTPGGTRMVHEIRPGPASTFTDEFTNPNTDPRFTAVGEVVFFIADDGVHGRELWRTDGTPQGTRLVVDLNPGPAHGVREMVSFADGLALAADDGTTGTEVWWSDGTAAGTRLVRDLARGPEGSNPEKFVVFGNRVYFRAYHCAVGVELWQSDGTFEGTGLVADVRPGVRGSDPEVFVVRPDALYFVADDGAHGRELRVLDFPSVALAPPDDRTCPVPRHWEITCPAAPIPGCSGARSSHVAVRGHRAKVRLARLDGLRGTSALGNPIATTWYLLCAYDRSGHLVTGTSIPPNAYWEHYLENYYEEGDVVPIGWTRSSADALAYDDAAGIAGPVRRAALDGAVRPPARLNFLIEDDGDVTGPLASLRGGTLQVIARFGGCFSATVRH